MSLNPTTFPYGIPAVPALTTIRTAGRAPGREPAALFVPAVDPNAPADVSDGHPEPRDQLARTVIVDVKTNGGDVALHQAVEVAWWELTTGQHGSFIPPHDVRAVLAVGELGVLRECRYLDRIAEYVPTAKDVDPIAWLATMLEGATLAGARPATAAAFLGKMFRQLEDQEIGIWVPGWNDRLWDVEAYAAGVLGLDHIPDLDVVCERLSIAPRDHTAAGDVSAVGTALLVLQGLAQSAPGPADAQHDQVVAAIGGAR